MNKDLLHKQFEIERFKALRFIGLYICAALIGFISISAGSHVKFRDIGEIFSQEICDTSVLFIILPFVAWFVGTDFSNRTIHNELKTGFTRFSVIFTRFITTFTIVAALHIMGNVMCITGFSLRKSFDMSIFTFRNLAWTLVVLLQLAAIVSFIIFIVFAVKNAAGAMGGTVLFSIVMLNILRNFLSDKDFFKLSCFSLAQTSDTKTLFLSGVFAVLTIAAMLALTHWIFRRTEVR